MGNNTFRYTPEQDRFIREYYPDHGSADTAKAFTRIFGIARNANHIKWRVEKLGVKVSPERLLWTKRNNVGKSGKTNNVGKTVPVGTIRTTKKTKGEPYIKTEKGWVMLKKYLIDCPKGNFIVHLDGDVTNCDPENLAVINKEIHGRMTVNHFWSEDPEITKTGIACCELESVLAKDGFDIRKPTKKKPRKGKPCTTNTGEYHISRLGDKYRVRIKRGALYVNRTAFRTLEAAIYFRDLWLSQKGLSLVDERFGN